MGAFTNADAGWFGLLPAAQVATRSTLTVRVAVESPK